MAKNHSPLLKDILRKWRTGHELSRVQAAEILGVSPKSVEAYELGVRRPVPLALESIGHRMANYSQSKSQAAGPGSKTKTRKRATARARRKTK